MIRGGRGKGFRCGDRKSGYAESMLDEELKRLVAEPCQRYGVRRLQLLGSAARQEDRPTNDYDFLAEFENNTPADMADRYFFLIEELSLQLGKPVQIMTDDMIRNPILRRSSERDLKPVYG